MHMRSLADMTSACYLSGLPHERVGYPCNARVGQCCSLRMTPKDMHTRGCFSQASAAAARTSTGS